ncbi:MAG: transposase [Chloroflexota bacterium]
MSKRERGTGYFFIPVVHKLPGVLAKVPRHEQKEVSSELRRIFYQESKEVAYQEAEAFCAYGTNRAKWEPVIPEAVRCLEKDLEECLSFYDFPREHWKYLRPNDAWKDPWRGQAPDKALGCLSEREELHPGFLCGDPGVKVPEDTNP